MPAVWKRLERRPASAIRWRLGGGIGPPKTLEAAKPASSVMMRKILGAPFGAFMGCGHAADESDRTRPTFPLNGSAGRGRTGPALLILPCATALDDSKSATVIPLHIVRSEEHTSELQSLMRISYAVFCL